MTEPARLCVLGSANMDLVATAPRAPEAGETITGTSFTTTAGGKGLNQAIAAARDGAPVYFVGAVGGDDHGTALLRALDAEGVDTSGVQRSAEPTGIAHIVVSADGENRIIVVPGANAAADLDAAARDRIAESGFLLAQLERPAALVREAFRHARSTGTRTVLTPAPVGPHAAEILDHSDIVIPNAGEAAALTGSADPHRAAARLSDGRIALITLGAAGAVLAEHGAVVAQIPAPAVPAVVDTTAAGDTLAAVFCSRLAEGAATVAAARIAVTAASISVQRLGASASIPTRAETDAAAGEGNANGTETRR